MRWGASPNQRANTQPKGQTMGQDGERVDRRTALRIAQCMMAAGSDFSLHLASAWMAADDYNKEWIEKSPIWRSYVEMSKLPVFADVMERATKEGRV